MKNMNPNVGVKRFNERKRERGDRKSKICKKFGFLMFCLVM